MIDEDGELCYKQEDTATNVQTNNVHNNDEDKEEVKKTTFEIDYNEMEDTFLDITLIIIIFFITCVSVVGICFILIFVIYKVIKTKKKSGLQQLLSPSLHHETASPNFHHIIPPTKSSPAPKKPTWSLRTTCIVKELGHGFYSKVYLAQDSKSCFVALKTVDNQKTSNADECISNEIDILTTVGTHLNVVKLLGKKPNIFLVLPLEKCPFSGFNREEKLIVMEYCFNGNLRDYIFRYRDYFMDEINPSTGELAEESSVFRSPTDSDQFPMSDFLGSLHVDTGDADTDTESLKHVSIGFKDPPSSVLQQNRSLIKTRRLLYWSYQISKEQLNYQ